MFLILFKRLFADDHTLRQSLPILSYISYAFVQRHFRDELAQMTKLLLFIYLKNNLKMR